MPRIILYLVIVLLLCLPAFAEGKVCNIGVVVPMQHKALDDIVAGFTETMKSDVRVKCNVTVKNSFGDQNIQRSIIQQMINGKVDYIVPISTQVMQIVMSMNKDIPVVTLASLDIDQHKNKGARITGVLDEIPIETIIEFLKGSHPNVKSIALIYNSANEKVFPDVERALKFARSKGIKVQRRVVSNIVELKDAVNTLEKDTDAILILKDHVVVSGVSILSKVAQKRKIIFVSSDEGTVSQGASFALGVTERDIGMHGAKLVQTSLLNKQDVRDIPIVSLADKFDLFVNKKACQSQGASVDSLLNVAQSRKLKVKVIG